MKTIIEFLLSTVNVFLSYHKDHYFLTKKAIQIKTAITHSSKVSSWLFEISCNSFYFQFRYVPEIILRPSNVFQLLLIDNFTFYFFIFQREINYFRCFIRTGWFCNQCQTAAYLNLFWYFHGRIYINPFLF